MNRNAESFNNFYYMCHSIEEISTSCLSIFHTVKFIETKLKMYMIEKEKLRMDHDKSAENLFESKFGFIIKLTSF